MSQEILKLVEKTSLKAEVPQFAIGDTVDVHTRILEGEDERIQIFSGTVIARSGSGTPRDVHRPPDRAGRRRRAQVPAALAQDRQDRSQAERRHPPGQAVLPPRPRRQGGHASASGRAGKEGNESE